MSMNDMSGILFIGNAFVLHLEKGPIMHAGVMAMKALLTFILELTGGAENGCSCN